jgi:hypothetical protein
MAIMWLTPLNSNRRGSGNSDCRRESCGNAPSANGATRPSCKITADDNSHLLWVRVLAGCNGAKAHAA